MGELSSTGHRIYGYHYVKKTPSAPATLAINEEQAAIVRSIFEMFASGRAGGTAREGRGQAFRATQAGPARRWRWSRANGR